MSTVKQIESWTKSGSGLLRPGRPNRIPPSPIVVPSGYTTLEWSDEFTGSTVDPAKWVVQNGRKASNEQSICYTQNVSVSGGNLVIQPKLETTTFGGTTRNYTSGYLDTAGKYAAQRPCRIEGCMALPLGYGISAGFWPAFWLRDIVGLGEIDIMEGWGTPSLQDGTPAEAPFGRYAGHAYPDTNTTAGGKGTWTSLRNADFNPFHVFWVEIAADGSLVYGMDNTAGQTISYSSNSFLQTAFPGTSGNGGYKIILNLQVGSAWNGPPTSTTDWTQNMKVNYVRVWKP